MSDSERDADNTALSCLGLSNPPDFLKSKLLGGFFGFLISITTLALVILAAIVLVRLIQAALSNANTSHEAVRNYGLVLAAIVGGFLLIWRSYSLHRQTNIAHQGQITDRISKAVEQIGAEKTVKIAGEEESTQPNLEVRIGGLYALERIAQQNLGEHIQIMAILCAYVRENLSAAEAVNTELRDDIATVLSIISRRSKEQKIKETEIRKASKTSINFSFRHANFENYLWGNKDISHSDFRFSSFLNSKLVNIKMQKCSFWGIFEGAKLHKVDASRSRFLGTTSFKQTTFAKSTFTECQFFDCDFYGAIVRDDNTFEGALFHNPTSFLGHLSDVQKENSFGVGDFDPNDGFIPDHWISEDMPRKVAVARWKAWRKTRSR